MFKLKRWEILAVAVAILYIAVIVLIVRAFGAPETSLETKSKYWMHDAQTVVEESEVK